MTGPSGDTGSKFWNALLAKQLEWSGAAPLRSGRRDSRQQGLAYNDLAADRQVVAAVQSLEAILDHASKGMPDGVVRVNGDAGGLALYLPGQPEPRVLYKPVV